MDEEQKYLRCITDGSLAGVIGHLDEFPSLVHVRGDEDNTGLHFAARLGFVDIVKKLLERGADCGAQNAFSRTPVMEAARAGQAETAALLWADAMQAGSDGQMTKPARDSQTVLSFAVENGHMNVVRAIVALIPDEDEKKRHVDLALVLAAGEGSLEMVAELLDSFGANTEARDYLFGDTALHKAAKNGRLDIVRTLVDRKANANVLRIPLLGESPLMLAVESGHKEVVSYLLDHAGARVDVAMHNGETAMHKAAATGSIELMKLLLDHGASVAASAQGISPLAAAARENQREAAIWLLQNTPSNVNDAGSKDRSAPLHLASARGHLEMARLLVEHKADVNVENAEGQTPVFLAAEGGHTELVSFLLRECKADPNIADSDGRTAVHLAPRLSTLRALVAAGAKTDVADRNGRTPLANAAINGHLAFAAFFVKECKANVDSVDKYGETPLHQAARAGHFYIVQFLGQRDADVMARNEDNKLPVDLTTDPKLQKLFAELMRGKDEWRNFAWLLCTSCHYLEYPGCQNHTILSRPIFRPGTEERELVDIYCPGKDCDVSSRTCLPWCRACRKCKGPKPVNYMMTTSEREVKAAQRLLGSSEHIETAMLVCDTCRVVEFPRTTNGLVEWRAGQLFDRTTGEAKTISELTDFVHITDECKGSVAAVRIALTDEINYLAKNFLTIPKQSKRQLLPYSMREEKKEGKISTFESLRTDILLKAVSFCSAKELAAMEACSSGLATKLRSSEQAFIRAFEAEYPELASVMKSFLSAGAFMESKEPLVWDGPLLQCASPIAMRAYGSMVRTIYNRGSSIFDGARDHNVRTRGQAMTFLRNFMTQLPESNQASIDGWIKTTGTGIILGIQSGEFRTDSWPNYHHQVLMVSGSGTIMGAFENTTHDVMEGPVVNDGRWHHVALTSGAQQRLYVDGKLVATLAFGIGGHHRNHDHGQLGSGCISGGAKGKPSPDFGGWFPFTGEMRDFRFWKTELKENEVELAMIDSILSFDPKFGEKIPRPVKKDFLGTHMKTREEISFVGRSRFTPAGATFKAGPNEATELWHVFAAKILDDKLAKLSR